MSKKKKHRKHKSHKKHNSPRNNQTNKTAVNIKTIETVAEEIKTNVTTETNTEETVKSTADSATVKATITRKNIILYTVLITLAFILIIFSSAVIFVNYVTRPVTVNTYTTPDFSRINNSFASSVFPCTNKSFPIRKSPQSSSRRAYVCLKTSRAQSNIL